MVTAMLDHTETRQKAVSLIEPAGVSSDALKPDTRKMSHSHVLAVCLDRYDVHHVYL
jgi:hypothetical protein